MLTVLDRCLGGGYSYNILVTKNYEEAWLNYMSKKPCDVKFGTFSVETIFEQSKNYGPWEPAVQPKEEWFTRDGQMFLCGGLFGIGLLYILTRFM